MPTTLWTQDPEYAAILLDCASNPPAERTFRYAFEETDTRYIGKRVQRLKRIRKQHLEAALAVRDATGDGSSFEANSVSVAEAIDQLRALPVIAEFAQASMGFVSHPIRYARPLSAEVLGAGDETRLERMVRRAREREAVEQVAA